MTRLADGINRQCANALLVIALQELVAEGLLSETRLRVGRIYHYPAKSAVRLDILAGFMKKAAEAPARPGGRSEGCGFPRRR